MKKNMNNTTEVTENITAQVEQTKPTNTEKKATKATTKKEEKKMAETKKNTETKTETPESMKAYRTNEAGEFLMTKEMLKDFRDANPELKVLKVKGQTDLVNIKTVDNKLVAQVRIDETAKKKQVHIHTGATKKTVSGKAEDGVRYKVIFREKTGKYECWNATPDGKRKMLKRGTEEEAMAEYESHFQKAEKKTTKKSA